MYSHQFCTSKSLAICSAWRWERRDMDNEALLFLVRPHGTRCQWPFVTHRPLSLSLFYARLKTILFPKAYQTSSNGHPTPCCWLHQEQEPTSLDAPSQLRLQQLGTHYLLTFTLVVTYQPSKSTSKPTCSDSLNLEPPAPLHSDFRALYKCCIIIISSS